MPFFLALLWAGLTGNRLQAASYSYSNYVSIPTLMATPQWCPSDAPITYLENQPTYFTASSLSACGYPTGTYDPNYFAAIDSDSFGDTAASGGNGGGLGGFPCGACAALYNSNGGKSVTVMITDECPQGGVNANNCWVGSYHLDLSQTAYNALLPSGQTSFPSNSGTNTLSGSTVSWRFVECPLTGSSSVTFANSGGKIAYEWANGSKSGYSPLMFLDQLFPIKSVSVNGASVSRDGSSNKLPNFWGGASGYSGTLTCVLTSYETSVTPVTVTVNSSYSPIESSPPGTTSSQFTSCGGTPLPTNTFTHTPVPGTPTPTPTNTKTNTFTGTPTPISGCPYLYYNGSSPHALANGSIYTGAGGTSSLTESAAAAYTGDTNGLNFTASITATGYYAQWFYNWAGYNSAPSSPYQPLVNLSNFSTLEFYMDNTTAAVSPMTWTVQLVDYTGSNGPATASTPVTFVVTGTGYQKFDFPTSDFMTGGANYSTTTVGEIQFEWLASAAAQSATIYFDNIAFYGTCPTATPTPSNTFTKTNTGTPTRTFTSTATSTPTLTPTNTSTSTATATRTNTSANTPTYTPTLTATNSATSSATATRTNTATGTPTNTSTNTQANTFTPTATPTNSPTLTRTNSPSNTPTNTQPNTATPTPTNSATNTATRTATSSATNTATLTATSTITPTFTNTNVITPTFTSTRTNTATSTPTSSATNSATASPTATRTNTATSTATSTITPTFTNTNVITPTFTNTRTNTATLTATNTQPNTPTSTPTSSATSTASNTATSTITPTFTNTNVITPTFTSTRTNTATSTPTSSVTSTATNTATSTITPTFTNTNVITPTFTGTPTRTPTSTSSNTQTSTDTQTATGTPTNTATLTRTSTATLTATSTPTNTNVITPTFTNTGTNTSTATPSNTPTATATRTPTSSATLTATQTSTNSATSTPTPQTIVTLTQTASSSTAAPGQTLTYTLVLNVSNNTAQNTLVTDNLPASTSFSNFGSGPTGTVTGSQITWSLGNLPAGSSVTLSFNVAVSTSASNGSNLSNQVSANYVGGSAQANASNVTVVVPTSTPTSTPILQIGVGGPYPNPSNGQPINFLVQVPGPSTVTIDVFTTSFRLVASQSHQVANSQTFDWNLKDQWGNPVADGLYYVRIQVTGAQIETKVLKVLLIR